MQLEAAWNPMQYPGRSACGTFRSRRNGVALRGKLLQEHILGLEGQRSSSQEDAAGLMCALVRLTMRPNILTKPAKHVPKHKILQGWHACMADTKLLHNCDQRTQGRLTSYSGS